MAVSLVTSSATSGGDLFNDRYKPLIVDRSKRGYGTVDQGLGIQVRSEFLSLVQGKQLRAIQSCQAHCSLLGAKSPSCQFESVP